MLGERLKNDFELFAVQKIRVLISVPILQRDKFDDLSRYFREKNVEICEKYLGY